MIHMIPILIGYNTDFSKDLYNVYLAYFSYMHAFMAYIRVKIVSINKIF